MTKQGINTDGVSSAANKLRDYNNNIDNEFRSMQSKAKQLDYNWRGAAGEAAKTTMHQLFQYGDERKKILQNYVNWLEKQINPGYINTEDTNTKLADKFK